MRTTMVPVDAYARMERSAVLRWSLGVLILVAACTPRVDLTANQPITINLNVKIDHEIRVESRG